MSRGRTREGVARQERRWVFRSGRCVLATRSTCTLLPCPTRLAVRLSSPPGLLGRWERRFRRYRRGDLCLWLSDASALLVRTGWLSLLVRLVQIEITQHLDLAFYLDLARCESDQDLDVEAGLECTSAVPTDKVLCRLGEVAA